MLSVSSGRRIPIENATGVNYLKLCSVAVMLFLLEAFPATGHGFQPPAAGSTAVGFGSGATIGGSMEYQIGRPYDGSLQVEHEAALGATDRGSLIPTREGALVTPEQITRRIFEQERIWSREVEEDIDRTERRLAPQFSEELQPARRLRERIRDRRRARVRQVAEEKGPMLRVLARRQFLRSQLGIGATFRDRVWNDPMGTIKHLREVLKKAQRLRDRHAEVAALGGLGKANLLLGRFPVAEEYFIQVLEQEKERQNADGQGRALEYIATARKASGRTGAALAASREALEIFKRTQNRRGQAMVLNNMGLAFRTQDDYRKAVEALQSALEADDTQGEERGLRIMNLAEVHIAYANYEPAKKALNDALEIQKKTGDVQAQALTLMSLADVAASEGMAEKAVEPLVQALEVLDKAKLPTNPVKKKIGDLWLSLGQPDKARSFVEESGSESSLGRYHLAVEAFPKAEEHFRNVLKTFRETGNPDDAFVGCTGLGLAAERRGDLRRAETSFEKGVKAVEDTRTGMLPVERKNFYAATVDGFARAEAAKGLVRVRMKLKKPDQTITEGEITRAREFTDNICRRTDISNLKVPQDILDKDAELQNVVASLEQARDIMPRQKDPERYDAIAKDLDRARAELKAFVSTLWKTYPRYAAVRHPRPIDLKHAAIGKDEHVVSYDVLGEGVAIKLLRQHKVVKAVYVPWKSDDLEKDIRKFRQPFEKVKLGAFNVDLARKLYDRLLAPVTADLPKGTALTIIPDGVLALLPFEALVTRGTPTWKKAKWGEYPTGLGYVGDVYPVVYYQSLTALTLARELALPTAGERLLVVADPVFQTQDKRAAGAKEVKIAKEQQDFVVSLMDAVRTEDGAHFSLQRLAETTELATYLKGLYPAATDVLTGLQASKQAFFTEVAPKIGLYGKLVLATHGLASNTLPGVMEPALALSMVPLGTDGFLTMTEVMGLNANADVVALTACQTGLGKILPGEGVMSMGRAFQAAGAKTVLMSLWSVSEAGSVKLMEIFFTHMKSGLPKLPAWTQARKDLRAQGYDHPFFWAPFIMVGGRE